MERENERKVKEKTEGKIKGTSGRGKKDQSRVFAERRGGKDLQEERGTRDEQEEERRKGRRGEEAGRDGVE